jgi:hypothetical protein
METIDNILKYELDLVVKDIIADYDRKKMRASGNFEKSLEVQVESNQNIIKGKILGAQYAEQLNSGRGKTGSGDIKPSRNFVSIIRKWIEDKRISSDLNPSALAYIRARSIHMKGWKRTQVDLINDIITPQRIQSIINKVGSTYANIITTELRTELNKLKLQ